MKRNWLAMLRCWCRWCFYCCETCKSWLQSYYPREKWLYRWTLLFNPQWWPRTSPLPLYLRLLTLSALRPRSISSSPPSLLPRDLPRPRNISYRWGSRAVKMWTKLQHLVRRWFILWDVHWSHQDEESYRSCWRHRWFWEISRFSSGVTSTLWSQCWVCASKELS